MLSLGVSSASYLENKRGPVDSSTTSHHAPVTRLKYPKLKLTFCAFFGGSASYARNQRCPVDFSSTGNQLPEISLKYQKLKLKFSAFFGGGVFS